MDFRHFDLLLYDIDGTLVDTGGAGMSALSKAAERFFGAPAPQLDLAGSTDLGIIQNLIDHYGHDLDARNVDDFFALYHGLLESNLASGDYPGRVIDGVREALAHGEAHQIPTGLLTGNTKMGAQIKMRHYWLQQHFPYGAFGDDHADRNLLGPVALERASFHHGRAFDAAATLVIGDTPKDIACAHAMGGKCLAVATGSFSADALIAAGADWVVHSLEEWLP
jgi:phosphoglycolate phosphatase-like HAD superfamily hydrolase